MAFITDLNR